MSRHLETVVELQDSLRELRSAKQLVESGPPALQELRAEHRAQADEIAELESEREEADRKRRTAESTVEDAQAKLAHFQAQISRVTTQREYGALLHEIDTVKAKIRETEDEGLAALEQSDAASEKLGALRESFEELEARYTSMLEEWKSERPAIEHRIETLEGRIQVFRERLPKPLLNQFERLSERHNGEPLAPIANVDTGGGGPVIRHCGKCNYRIRPQVVVEIQNEGSLIPCDSCQRILYLTNDT